MKRLHRKLVQMCFAAAKIRRGGICYEPMLSELEYRQEVVDMLIADGFKAFHNANQTTTKIICVRFDDENVVASMQEIGR